MMIRLPDFNMLSDTRGTAVEEQFFSDESAIDIYDALPAHCWRVTTAVILLRCYRTGR